MHQERRDATCAGHMCSCCPAQPNACLYTLSQAMSVGLPCHTAAMVCLCPSCAQSAAQMPSRRNGECRYANEDVTLGSWLLGLEVVHSDERRFCCDSAARCAAQVLGCQLA